MQRDIRGITSDLGSNKMRFWREAATLILATKLSAAPLSSSKYSPNPRKPNNGHPAEDYQVLMLERSGSSSFMPSRLVFPGGTLSDVDHSRKWCDLFQRLSKSHPSDLTKCFEVSGPRPPMMATARPEWTGITAEVAFRICAIRETFEESGILLVLSEQELSTLADLKGKNITSLSRWNESEKLELHEWRKSVIGNADAFMRMCEELRVFPNLWALHEWSNWLTPVLQRVDKPQLKPLRFDTMFYICCLESDGLPATSPDEAETVRYQWKRPSEFLSHISENLLLKLDSPQVYELERVFNFPLLRDLHDFCWDRTTKGLERYMPTLTLCTDGYILCLPGDWCYPVSPDYEGTTDQQHVHSVDVDQQIPDYSKSMHRVIFKHGQVGGSLICNLPLSCGHVAPLDCRLYDAEKPAAADLASKL